MVLYHDGSCRGTSHAPYPVVQAAFVTNAVVFEKCLASKRNPLIPNPEPLTSSF